MPDAARDRAPYEHRRPLGTDDLALRLRATQAVLATREAELFRLKGPCSSALSGPCPLHYAHSGPCDVGGRRREGKF